MTFDPLSEAREALRAVVYGNVGNAMQEAANTLARLDRLPPPERADDALTGDDGWFYPDPTPNPEAS